MEKCSGPGRVIVCRSRKREAGNAELRRISVRPQRQPGGKRCCSLHGSLSKPDGIWAAGEREED